MSPRWPELTVAASEFAVRSRMNDTGEPLPDNPAAPESASGDPSAPSELTRPLLLDASDPESAATAAVPVAPIDPWAHRRGEPRLFAFLWTIYLLVAVGGSLLWLSRSTVISTSTYGPAARIMLLVVAAGSAVLWPMVRLSQASPRGSGVRAAMADVVVVLFPMQIMLWPLVMLAQWPAGIVAALALMSTLWVLLTGGVIALGTSGPCVRSPHERGLGERAAWMVVCIVLVAAAPTFALARRAAAGPDDPIPKWLAMLSPFTAVPALTGQGFSGPQRPVSPEQWRALALIAAPVAILWSLAALRHRASRGRRVRDEWEGDQGGSVTASGLD